MAKKLYVGNLSYNTTEEGLKDAFSTYSDNITVSIITDSMSGRSKGFGFVEFEDDSQADAALEMNGKEIDGRTLVVNEARPREEQSLSGIKKIYVGNLSSETTEETLRSSFSKYGEIVDAVVITDQETGESKGFGFVEFSTEEEAQASLEMNGMDMDGSSLNVNIARPKSNDRRGGGDRGGDRGGFRRERY